MDLPDSLLLSRVQPANIHHDKKSLEKRVRYKQIIKRKFKLAGNIIKPMMIFTFFTLTRTKDACRRDLRICIRQKDWENKDPDCLNEEYTYTDLTKAEAMEKSEVLAKMRERDNGFKRVAILCEKKYEEFRSLLPRMREAQKEPSDNQIFIADMALSRYRSEIAKDVLIKLGLL